MPTHGSEERTKLRKAWVDHAIQLAMQSKWADAVTANRNILEQFPKDVDAFNRLGRALRELGQYREAREAYRQAVQIDSNNGIAQKNLASLENMNVDGDGPGPHERVDPRLFIADTGKSAPAGLVAVRDRTLVAKMAVGNQVHLNPEGRALYVRNAVGDTLGQVEPKMAQRLIDLINGGNKYTAAMMSIDDTSPRVIIHETYQHPAQIGKVSFPSRAEGGTLVRPYTKESPLKYSDFEEEDEDGELDEGFQTEGETEGEEPIEQNEFDEEQTE